MDFFFFFFKPWSPGGHIYGPENGYNFPYPYLLRVNPMKYLHTAHLPMQYPFCVGFLGNLFEYLRVVYRLLKQ